MKVRFSRWISGSMIVAGVGLLGAGIALAASGSASGGVPVVVAGLVLAAFGLAYLGALPYAVIGKSEVRFPLTRGSAARVRLRPRDWLKVDGSRLYVVHGTSGKEALPMRRGFARADDWEAMEGVLDEMRRERRL